MANEIIGLVNLKPGEHLKIECTYRELKEILMCVDGKFKHLRIDGYFVVFRCENKSKNDIIEVLDTIETNHQREITGSVRYIRNIVYKYNKKHNKNIKVHKISDNKVCLFVVDVQSIKTVVVDDVDYEYTGSDSQITNTDSWENDLI